MSDAFLPEGTEIPASGGNYMKFESGENKFRVLSSAIIGWKLWVDGKPLRRKNISEYTNEELAGADTNKFTGDKRKPQYFWAFTVFNYKEKTVQILELSQVTIMRGIESYLNDEDYGSPKDYDLVVTQFEGDNGKIQYTVKAKPPKAIDEGIKVFTEDLNIDLTALYRGEDPFKGTTDDTEIDLDEADKAVSK